MIELRLTSALLVTLAVILSMSAVTPVPSAASVAMSLPPPASVPQPTTASPSVLSHTTFPLFVSGSTVSPAFASSTGDLILAWFSTYGREWVSSVTDSTGDSFVQKVNSSMAYGPSSARNGLSLWAAADVKGGSLVTVDAVYHVSPGWTPLASATIVDVTGVAIQPIDSLGIAVNTSHDPNQRNKTFTCNVTAGAGDLVLGGVAARGYNNFVAAGGDARVDQSVARAPSGKAMTMSVFDRSEGATSGTVWLNATSNLTSAWVGDCLSVAGSGNPPNHFTVKFVETGLPTGATWSVALGNVLQTSTSTVVSFSELNGSYNYSVHTPPTYSVSPRAGTVTVSGITPPVDVSFVGFIQHIVVIMMENANLHSILTGKSQPYERYLYHANGSIPNFYAVCHRSPPDYVALTSGNTSNCENQKGVLTAKNLPDTLEAAGMTWAGYMESMPKPCDSGLTATYDGVNHNPFLLYQDIVGNASRCKANDVNSAQFNQSLASGTLPTFSMYSPNDIDDCHGTATQPENRSFCDSWLRGFLAPILNHTANYSSTATQDVVAHTAFIIAYDEGDNKSSDAGYSVGNINTPYCYGFFGVNLTACGGRTYVVVVSPYSVGTSFGENATDMGLTTTIEWLLDIPSDGGYDGSPYFPAMTSLFSFP
jgi:Phosphoesterase family